MSWETAPELWHTLNLGGEVWPGLWTVTTDGIKRELKISKAKGEDGLSIRDEGMTAPRVVCEGIILSREFPALQEKLRKHSPKQPGGLRTPLTIVHPIPNTLGIDKIYIDGTTITHPTSADPMRCKLECIQWFPAPKPVKKGKSAEGDEKPWGQPNPLYNINPPLSFSPGDDSVTDALRTGPDLPL